MLFFHTQFDLTKEQKDIIRKQVKEMTGEDSIFIPAGLDFIASIPVKKEERPRKARPLLGITWNKNRLKLL